MIMTILKTSHLTAGYGSLDEALRLTNAGMADFVDLGSVHVCKECRHWLPSKGKEGVGRCALQAALMRGRRGAQPRPLRASQQACRKWTSDLGAPRA
jgi:hypothetical protein